MVRQIEKLAGRFRQQGFEPAAQRLDNLARELYEEKLIPNEIDVSRVFQHSNFTYYQDRGTVLVEGIEKGLTPTENAVLKLLTEHVGKIVTFANFAKEAFHANDVDLTSVRNETKTYIMYLRRKLGENLLEVWKKAV